MKLFKAALLAAALTMPMGAGAAFAFPAAEAAGALALDPRPSARMDP